MVKVVKEYIRRKQSNRRTESAEVGQKVSKKIKKDKKVSKQGRKGRIECKHKIKRARQSKKMT